MSKRTFKKVTAMKKVFAIPRKHGNTVRYDLYTNKA